MKDILIYFENDYGTGIARVRPVCPLMTVRNITDDKAVKNEDEGTTSHPSMIC